MLQVALPQVVRIMQILTLLIQSLDIQMLVNLIQTQMVIIISLLDSQA